MIKEIIIIINLFLIFQLNVKICQDPITNNEIHFHWQMTCSESQIEIPKNTTKNITYLFSDIIYEKTTIHFNEIVTPYEEIQFGDEDRNIHFGTKQLIINY